MATGYRSEVSRVVKASTLRNESDGSHIPGFEKYTGIEEVLDLLHYVFPYDIPRCFEQTTIKAIKTWIFIIKDTPHHSLYLIWCELQIKDISMLVI